MDCTEISSEVWISWAEEAWSTTEGASSETLVVELGKRLAAVPGGRLSTALAEGMAELVRYATQGQEEIESALDAEVEALAVSRRIVRPILEAKLQQCLDALDARQTGQSACPQCEAPSESQGRRARSWGSLLGPLHLTRRYRHCAPCQHGQAPAQDALGLPGGEFTARLEEVCTMMATTVPHEMAVKLIEQMTGVVVSEKAVQDMVEKRATALAQRLEDAAETCAPYEPNGLPVAEPQRPDDAVEQPPELAYLDLDGVVPMTREELPTKKLTAQELLVQQQAKENKVRGGKGRRYELVGREVKNAVLYRGEDCAKEGPTRGCLLDKRYVSYLGDWQSFASLLWVEMLRQGFDQATRLVILSDGAEWIRSLAEWLPIDVMLILDLYHVKHRIWEVANLLYGPKTAKAAAWANTQCDRAEAGNAPQVIEALGFLRPRREDVKKKVSALRDYLKNNLDRMDYPRYREMGLRVGSGAVESANYHVTGARMKLQGMRWSEQGARDMAFLRADLFNGNWEKTTRALLAA